MYRLLSKFVRLSLLLAICLLPQLAYSLDRSRSISQFHHTQWTSKEGAPSQIVALTQTSDGFLWIGTSRGLFTFDGVKFEKYKPPLGVELPSDNIYALKASPDGGMWISFRPSGLGFIKNGKIEVVTAKEKLPTSQIYCLEVDGKGRLWAGTHNGLALRRDDGGWTEIGPEWEFTPRRVWSMFTDRGGRMWVAVQESIVVLGPNEDRFQETGDRADVVTSFSESPDGRVWRGQYRGIIKPVAYPGNSPHTVGIKVPQIFGGVMFDRDGGLWFTDGAGVKRLRSPEILDRELIDSDDSRLEVFEVGDNLSGPLLEDREGNIWVGSPQGLNRFRYSYFIPHRASARYRNMTLAADPNSGIWVGSSLDLPLIHFDGESGKSFPKAAFISSVSRGTDGVMWWGANGRIFKQIGDVIEVFDQPAHLQGDWFWEVFQNDPEQFQWVSLGDHGLISFDEGKWGTWKSPSGLPDRGPSASFRENSERTWLGYTEDRVAMLENGVGKLFTSADGIDIGRIRVIRKGHDRIWIGGERGLAIFDGTRFHTIRTTMADRFGTVSGVVFSRDGSLWLNEVQGIVRMAKDEVERLIETPDHRASFQQFDFEDGLPGSPQMNWTVSTAVESVDGRLWFATDGGLVSIDPTNLVSNPLPPPVSVRSLTVGDKLYDVHKSIELPEGTEELSIEYTALSLSIPERVQFKYMLEGVDADWHDAHSRREAFYTNLGPGEYRFRVIASNNDGVWNNDGATLDFQIAPRFYQTSWFIGLCGLIVAAIVFVLLRRRLELVESRLKLKFEERLAERARIAQDLHDTLLQGCVSASMQLDVAVDSLPEKSPARPRFEHVHDMIKLLINEGRETVKGLRSSATSDKAGFEEMLFQMREEFDPEHTVNFQIGIGGQQRPLHPIIYDEVRHIAQEAIFNAFRHARAKDIDVSIEYSSRKFLLLVSDDGRGIEPDIVESGREGHWGLTGMRERAESIGGQFKVWSAERRGTGVQLTIPGRIAYTNSETDSVKRFINGLSRRFRRKRGSI